MDAEDQRKIKLFANEPLFKKTYLQTNSTKDLTKDQNLKIIFPLIAKIERLKNFQLAREMMENEKQLNERMKNFLTKNQMQLISLDENNRRINFKKKKFFEKYEVEVVDQKLQKDLKQLDRQINHYEDLATHIQIDKGDIMRMLNVTKIKEALKRQNKLLREKRRELNEEQDQLDAMLTKKKR